MKHKNVVTLPVSFTGSYTEDEPTSPWQKKSNFTEAFLDITGLSKVGGCHEKSPPTWLVWAGHFA